VIFIVECGIEKYDQLPDKVALIDVDALRHCLNRIESGSRFRRLDLILNLGPLGLRSMDKIRRVLIEDLEEARKIHKGELDPFYATWLRKIIGILDESTEGSN